MAHGRADSLSLSLKMQRYMENLIVGIDFSKKTLNYCVLSGSVDNIAAEGVLGNNRKGWSSLLRLARKRLRACDACGLLFCGEDTGLYSKTVSDALALDGWFMWLESALRIKRSMGICRGKNDKKDSRDIAIYAARFQDKRRRHVAPDELTEAVRVLFMRRKFLVEQRDALRRRNKEMKPVLKGNSMLQRAFRSDDRLDAAYCKEIAAIEKEIRRLVDSSAEMKRNYQILTSMKGIGLINAVALIVYTVNFKKFDYDARRIASFWGVAPFGYDSGTSLHTTPHVSNYADKYLKSLLSEAALCAMRFCPVIRDYAARLSARGKHPNIVRNNVKNKMLHILVAMVRDGKYFQQAA